MIALRERMLQTSRHPSNWTLQVSKARLSLARLPCRLWPPGVSVKMASVLTWHKWPSGYNHSSCPTRSGTGPLPELHQGFLVLSRPAFPHSDCAFIAFYCSCLFLLGSLAVTGKLHTDHGPHASENSYEGSQTGVANSTLNPQGIEHPY